MAPETVGFWEGIMDVARGGRGEFRLVVQPLIAILFGIRFGIADAKEGKDPFLLRLLKTSPHRAKIAKAAASDVLMPYTIAVVLDGILQYLTLGYVRPLAALVVGAILIWLPFSVARALTNRIYKRSARGRASTAPA